MLRINEQLFPSEPLRLFRNKLEVVPLDRLMSPISTSEYSALLSVLVKRHFTNIRIDLDVCSLPTRMTVKKYGTEIKTLLAAMNRRIVSIVLFH